MTEVIARSSDVRIGPDTRVTLHFAICLASGEEIDTTRRGNAATFRFGDGNLLPGFEAALVGLAKGDDEQLPIAACDAFGEWKPENYRVMPKRDFGHITDVELEPGLVVSFGAADGELPGVVKAVSTDEVEVDFNHPLAGKDVLFDVSILDVERV